mmetsp:Transcript_22294/g.51068  ORF Transcript_22294/g.51068 Transcript_22294/m.51068 type:complete len:281 (-) Transcript_22294:31-873(-)
MTTTVGIGSTQFKECGSILVVLIWATSLQEPQCAMLVAATTLIYATTYAIIRKTGLFQPSWNSGPSSSGRDNAPGWRSRVLGSVNAVLLVFGSVLCFLEWPYDPVAEGWTGPDRVWSNPVTSASLFVGYLQWDLCWLIWHRKSAANNDPGAIIHHSIFIAVTHYVLHGYFFKRPFAWLSMAELSTPFLNARWFLAASDRKDGVPYLLVSLGFSITFLATRVVGYTLGLYDLWQSYTLWKDSGIGLHGVVLGLHMAYLLNLFWSTKVVSALQRAMRKRKKK